VIGCGGIAQHAHLPSIQRTPRAKLMAVCDPYPDVAREVARVNGLQQADAYAEHAPILARQDVDAVTICAPTTQHAAITVEALRAGKHVLVEKPMAVTSDEARTMTAAAEAAGRTLMVGYNHSYDPAARHVKEMLAAGDLGEILYAEIFFYEDLYSWTAGALSRTIRAKDQKSFWPVYDNAYENLREFIHNFDSHVLNLMRLLLGNRAGSTTATGTTQPGCGRCSTTARSRRGSRTCASSSTASRKASRSAGGRSVSASAWPRRWNAIRRGASR
jgi:predicted dehydrogenase